MSSQDTGFFIADEPPQEFEEHPLLNLAAWQRVSLCLAFIALMVAYLGWLLEG
jgi:hypothetical protein